MTEKQPNVVILHNPRCSKSRATLELLHQRGIAPEVVDYLHTPPDRAQLEHILRQLGMQPRALLRTTEPIYRQLGLDDEGLSRDALLQAMVEHPILIERPIVLAHGKAALGRPPENVLDILP